MGGQYYSGHLGDNTSSTAQDTDRETAPRVHGRFYIASEEPVKKVVKPVSFSLCTLLPFCHLLNVYYVHIYSDSNLHFL